MVVDGGARFACGEGLGMIAVVVGLLQRRWWSLVKGFVFWEFLIGFFILFYFFGNPLCLF